MLCPQEISGKDIKRRAPCSSIDAVEARPKETSLPAPAVLRAGERTCRHRCFVMVTHASVARAEIPGSTLLVMHI